jgi:uncharacterized protein
MIIDSHTHIFGKDVIQKREQYCSSDECFGLLYSHPKSKLSSAEELVNSMDEHCISKSLVLNIGWKSHEMCVRTNDYILESVSRYPARLIGFCSVQPVEKENALAELDRCHKAGARGLGELRPDTQGYDLLDDALMKPLVEESVRRGMQIMLHASEPVGHVYAGKGSLTPGILYSFALKYPALGLILAHFGGGLPFYELMPEVSAALANVYYDTAAAPFLYGPRIYRVLLDIIGSRRLLFGSDWPLLDQSRLLDHVGKARLKKREREDVLYKNADRLFH